MHCEAEEGIETSCPTFPVYDTSSHILISPTNSSMTNFLKGRFYEVDLRHDQNRARNHVALAVALNSCSNVSRRACNAALKSFLPTESSNEGDRVPRDVRSARAILGVEPKIVDYVCCPTCSAVYHPGDLSPLLSGDYQTFYLSQQLVVDPEMLPVKSPFYCLHKDTPDEHPCNTALFETSVGTARRGKGDEAHYLFKPKRTFPFQPMKSWLGRLLSREGVESSMDKAWDRCKRHDGSAAQDIWEAKFLSDFQGADHQWFGTNSDKEGRYCFSLFLDWYNPFGNKISGKTVSVGVIFLACLNLPEGVRFLPQNVYLCGIIPGESVPKLQRSNHFLNPIVDELLEFWDTGVFFSRTALFPEGRLVRCALVVGVADAPAMSKIAGKLSNASGCPIHHMKIGDIGNLEVRSWETLTNGDYRKLAYEWRFAQNPNSRKVIEKRFGIRYSPLIRLPYWDPTRMTPPEPMHCLLLGLVQHHCRKIWDTSDDYATAEDVNEDEFRNAVHCWRDSTDTTELKKLRKSVLKKLCSVHFLNTDGTKENLCNTLISSVSPTVICDTMHYS